MTVFASSNFITLAATKEIPANYGTVTGSAAMQYMPNTGVTLKYSKETMQSNTMDQTRQLSDLIDTGFQVSGGFGYEFAPQMYDMFLEGAMWKEWSNTTNVTIVGTTNQAARTITAASLTPFSTVVAGQYVRVAGFVNAANNGVFKVLSKTDLVLTLDTVYTTLVNETSVAGVTVKGSMLRNPALPANSVRTSYFFEKALEDLDPVQRFGYGGNLINSMSLSVQSKAIVTGSLDFIGKGSTAYTTATQSTGAIVAAPVKDIFNSLSHIGSMRINGVLANGSGVYFQGFDFSIGHSLRGISAVGNLGNVGVSPGTITVTGNMSPFFAAQTMYDRFINSTAFHLSFEVINQTTGEGYVFSFPRIKINDDDVGGSGKDQDVIESISWTALKDTTYSTTMQIDRFLTSYV